MYIKIILPKVNGKKAYSNKGSARQATNYLEHEAKKVGEKAVFFNQDTDRLTGDEAVAMIDSNRKGLRAGDDKFYSIVISPSDEELTHIGNDAAKLRDFTKNVLHAYAENFTLKDGGKLAEKELVWVATQHNERLNRGTDEGASGTRKEGLQTHIHIMVSARNREQKVTLNPLGEKARFNRVNFYATANLLFEQKYDYAKPGFQQARPTTGPKTVIEPETIAARAEAIRNRAALNAANPVRASRSKRENAAEVTLTPAQKAARDQRLQAQVERINLTLGEDNKLDFEQVREAAKQREYDKTFYGRLGRIGREAAAGKVRSDAYILLRTGRNSVPPGTPAAGQTLAQSQRVATRSGAFIEPDQASIPTSERAQGGVAAIRKLITQAERLAAASAPQARTQDVRADWEKRQDYELE